MVEACFQPETLSDDGHEHVDGHGDPDLGLHCVLALPVECLDPQMLFDPFEEEFHLPPRLVDPGDGKCGQDEVVGKECESLVRFQINLADATQRIRIDLD